MPAKIQEGKGSLGFKPGSHRDRIWLVCCHCSEARSSPARKSARVVPDLDLGSGTLSSRKDSETLHMSGFSWFRWVRLDSREPVGTGFSGLVRCDSCGFASGSVRGSSQFLGVALQTFVSTQISGKQQPVWLDVTGRNELARSNGSETLRTEPYQWRNLRCQDVEWHRGPEKRLILRLAAPYQRGEVVLRAPKLAYWLLPCTPPGKNAHLLPLTLQPTNGETKCAKFPRSQGAAKKLDCKTSLILVLL